MRIRDCNVGQRYELAKDLHGVVQIQATTPVPDRIMALFAQASLIIADAMKQDSLPRHPVTVVFCRGGYTLDFTSEQVGTYVSIAAYDVAKLEHLPGPAILITLVEELVHHFYHLSDEVETAHQVCRLIPGLQCDPNTGRYLR